MVMKCVWACTCGAETPCQPNDIVPGAIFQCPICRRVFGCIRPRAGGQAWITISDQDVVFHRLLIEPELE